MNSRQQKKRQIEGNFHSYHKSSVAWYICGGKGGAGGRDSSTKFILIDEILLRKRDARIACTWKLEKFSQLFPTLN